MSAALPVLSADAVRAAEAEFPELLADGTLMQRAAYAVAAECLTVFRSHGAIVGRRVLLLVGSGDNGGDALFAGAVMAARGVAVFALPMSVRMHDDGLSALLRSGGHVIAQVDALAQLTRFDMVLDGIVGLGSTRPLEGASATMAEAVAEAAIFTVAVDVPSGVHADTGAVNGISIEADLTITFGALRRAHVIVPAALRCGEIVVANIGVPMASADLEVTDEGGWFAPPAVNADKYARGVVGLVTGSSNYPGAALLSIGAALQSGCGMVRYFGTARASVLIPYPEVVVRDEVEIAQAHCQAWIVGCGGGTDDAAAALLETVLAQDVPVLVDADGITLLSSNSGLQALVIARAARGLLTVLTPHAGELKRLAYGLGLTINVEGDRLNAAMTVANALSLVVLLKGPATIVTNGVNFVTTPILDSQLATAGSGDVLAGLLGGAIARWSAVHLLTVQQLMELAAACALRHSWAVLPEGTTASDLLVGLEDAQSGTMAP
jgi:hydroxyethylthiazole kinase-like uncharacterized protein yjeF